MPLSIVESGLHVRVSCDGCRSASAELCGRRQLAAAARAAAVPKFRKAGWHHDPGRRSSARAESESEASGSGRWYCPACAKKTHL